VNQIRRWTATAALALLLVAGVAAGQAPGHAARACTPGWTQTAYTSAVATDPLGQQAATDIVAFTDNCGLRQYKYSVWSPTGSALSNVGIGYRVWVCGSLFNQVHTFQNPTWTGWINYGGCGNQTDNASGVGGTTANTSAAAYNSNNFGVFYDHIG
jgi:hypothetical protein